MKSSGMTWFKGNDNLAGTDVYGDVNKPQEPFSVKFDNKDFDQYQISTGNCDRWIVFSKKYFDNWEYWRNNWRDFQTQNRFPPNKKSQAKKNNKGLRLFK